MKINSVIERQTVALKLFQVSRVEQKNNRKEKMTKYKIVKTQGTKESVGAFMVFDEKNEEIFDNKGNNAWNTLQEAEEVKQQTNQERK